MTIHYHGTPITPRSVLLALAGRHFCVSFAAPADVEVCHRIGQSVMLDNGAFSAWKAGKPTDWPGYYEWCDKWLRFKTTWAVIPDVIDGGEIENDLLLQACPLPRLQAAPVWHLHESFSRLRRLCMDYPRVCFGSSGEFATVGTKEWHERVGQAFSEICSGGVPKSAIHMLRGMSLSGGCYPFASVDSTDIARNHCRAGNDVSLKETRARWMADRWDGRNCPAEWAGADAAQAKLF
jgi:hypothetical protein